MALTETLTAQAVFEAALKKVAASVISGVGKGLAIALSHLERDFGDHLRQAFERCSRVRTILNRDESVDLLSLYINLSFRSGLSATIDDYDLIDQIKHGQRAVISGLGGGGKSMFMRYLWLSMFENPNGRVPVFVELRRFNDLTTDDFGTFLFRSIVDARFRFKTSDFENMLEAGRLTLILDGFDEIREDRRTIVESEILRLSRQYKDIILVVSGRPDNRFSGWQSFQVFHVKGLNKNQVIELIGRLSYDEKIRKKFAQRVKRDLYDKHQSFLSNPLLATMMMLTFDQFADIPEKVYLFYEQAFETLFAKHDATKEAYKRKTFTDLPIDIFKKTMAYFCLISYYDEIIEFSDTEIVVLIRKAVTMVEHDIDPEKFLQDVCESVCLLQKEGLKFTFTHRSFQEYFAAFCLSSLIPKRISSICPKIIGRLQDNVIPMLFDMNRDTLETEYIGPALEEILNGVATGSHEIVIRQYMTALNCILLAHRYDHNRAGSLFLHSLESRWRLLKLLPRLYPAFFSKIPKDDLVETGDRLTSFGVPEDQHIYHVNVEGFEITEAQSKWLDRVEFKRLSKTFSLSTIAQVASLRMIKEEVSALKNIQSDIRSRSIQRARSLDELFST